jgi:hypothetical protein
MNKSLFYINTLHVAFAASGLVALASGLALWAIMAGIAAQAQELKAINSELATLELQNREIGNFKQSYGSYKENLDAVGELFVDPQNPVGFISFVETTALNMGLRPKISLVPADPLQLQSPLVFQVFVADEFPRIARFLVNLEYGPYLVEISNVSLRARGSQAGQDQPAGQGIDNGSVEGSFSIKAFTKGQT